MFNRLKKIFYFFLVFSFLPLSVSHTEESISEADIAEVVALYNEGKFTESIQKADRLLGPNGSNPTLLETKALSLQGSGQYDKALQILSILRKGKSAEQLQGYDFLTGQILMEAGKQNDAAPYFEKAVRDNYNITAAHYFLGIIDLQRNKPKEATPHFRAALESKDVSLKAPTLYYLGAFAAQKNQPEVASQYWKKALPAAQAIVDNVAFPPKVREQGQQMYRQIQKSLDQLSGLDKPFFANLGLSFGYDSNVLLVPTVDTGATGQSTLLDSANISLGYATRLLHGVFIPKFQAAGNLNYNAPAKGAQFLSQRLETPLVFGSENPFHFGIIPAVSFVLRNDVPTGSSEGPMVAQSLLVPIVVFAEKEQKSKDKWGGEASFQPQIFYDSTLATDLQKSGWELRARFYYQETDPKGLLNPGFDLTFQMMNTSGQEFRSKGGLLGLYNYFYWSNKLISRFKAGVGYNYYAERLSGVRSDIEFSGTFDLRFALSQSLSFSAEVTYLYNYSNIVDYYRYQRLTSTVAANYSF